MGTTKTDTEVFESASREADEFLELTELQMAVIGGGVGEVVFG